MIKHRFFDWNAAHLQQKSKRRRGENEIYFHKKKEAKTTTKKKKSKQTNLNTNQNKFNNYIIRKANKKTIPLIYIIFLYLSAMYKTNKKKKKQYKY